VGGSAASEIPLLSSFLYLFGEAGPCFGTPFWNEAAGLGPAVTRTEDSVRRGV
jgi:hypothetical protein